MSLIRFWVAVHDIGWDLSGAALAPLRVWAGGRGGVCVCYGGELECFGPCVSYTTCEQVVRVTHTVSPTPTYVRESPTVVPCNRGLGNGAEGGDPGNSGGRPGAAGGGNEGSGFC